MKLTHGMHVVIYTVIGVLGVILLGGICFWIIHRQNKDDDKKPKGTGIKKSPKGKPKVKSAPKKTETSTQTSRESEQLQQSEQERASEPEEVKKPDTREQEQQDGGFANPAETTSPTNLP